MYFENVYYGNWSEIDIDVEGVVIGVVGENVDVGVFDLVVEECDVDVDDVDYIIDLGLVLFDFGNV